MTSTQSDEPLTVPNPPTGWPRIVPHLVYDDVNAAVDWMTDVFGFAERTWARHAEADGVIARTQMQVFDSIITVGVPSVHAGSPAEGVSDMLYVYVDDVDRHYARAVERGAKIALDLDDMPWGDRRYQTTDPEGHQWVFAQATVEVDSLNPCEDEDGPVI